MKDNEKKVKATEEVKEEVQTEDNGAKLDDEQLAQVTGGQSITVDNIIGWDNKTTQGEIIVRSEKWEVSVSLSLMILELLYETRFSENIRQGVTVEYVSDAPETVRKEYANRVIKKEQG